MIYGLVLEREMEAVLTFQHAIPPLPSSSRFPLTGRLVRIVLTGIVRLNWRNRRSRSTLLIDWANLYIIFQPVENLQRPVAI